MLGAAIVVYNVRRFAKILPGILFLATLNGLVMTYSGHLVHQPSLAISRLEALGFTLLLAASCVVSAHFYDRRLTLVDRLALLTFVGCFLWGSVAKWGMIPLGLGFVALLLAWLRNYLLTRPGSATLQLLLHSERQKSK